MSNLRRRRILQLGGTSCLLAILPATALPSIPQAGLWCHVLEAGHAFGGAKPLAFAVDSPCSQFQGDGLYLYPAWGRPHPYQVRREEDGTLVFSNPASGELLWKQRLDGMAARFAGRIRGVLSPHELLAGRMPTLEVPARPLA